MLLVYGFFATAKASLFAFCNQLLDFFYLLTQKFYKLIH